MVEPDAIAIMITRCLGLAQAERHDAGPAQVDDPLATLAHDLADARVSERAKQLAVEPQTAIEGRDNEVEMIDAGSSHELHSRAGSRDSSRTAGVLATSLIAYIAARRARATFPTLAQASVNDLEVGAEPTLGNSQDLWVGVAR
jgi:hypothetical protein